MVQPAGVLGALSRRWDHTCCGASLLVDDLAPVAQSIGFVRGVCVPLNGATRGLSRWGYRSRQRHAPVVRVKVRGG